MEEETFTFKKIYQAYLDCRKKKKNKKAHKVFFYAMERHLLDLTSQLKTKKYKMGRFFCFVETYPTIREVFASSFRDRVVHHFLVKELEPFFEPCFIADSFACRKGKGTHRAVLSLQKKVLFLEKDHSGEIFYAGLDIKSFFMSIEKEILYSIIEKRLKKKYLKNKKTKKWLTDILWLTRIIIFTNPTENCVKIGNIQLFKEVIPSKSLFFISKKKGLPIGNLTSQFFANVYLNVLDQFVKRTIKNKWYFRYVDDFILLEKSGKKLFKIALKINNFLKDKLKLVLNFKKMHIQQTKKGINFLGYIVRGKYLLIRRKLVKSLFFRFASDKKRRNYFQNELEKERLALSSCLGSFLKARRQKLFLNFWESFGGY